MRITLAMLLAQRLGFDQFRERVKIYASNVDEESLNKARLANYTAKEVEPVPRELLAACFDLVGNHYAFNKDLRRAVIQDLMCRMELDLDELGARFGRADLAEHFASEWRRLEPLAAEGLCRLGARTVEVLPTGRLFLRHLAMVFDAYLAPAADEKPRFSQIV